MYDIKILEKEFKDFKKDYHIDERTDHYLNTTIETYWDLIRKSDPYILESIITRGYDVWHDNPIMSSFFLGFQMRINEMNICDHKDYKKEWNFCPMCGRRLCK